MLILSLRILSFTVTASFVAAIFHLLKHKKLKEGLALVWLAFSAATIAITYRFTLVEEAAKLLRIRDPNNLLLFLALIFVISACLIISVEVSRLYYQVTALIQEVALFKHQVTHPTPTTPSSPPPLTSQLPRVAIVNPPPAGGIKFIREGRCEQRLSSFQYVMVPISLPSIAGLLLSKGYDVKIWDCIADNIPPEQAAAELVNYHPQLVIFNVATPTFTDDLSFIANLKEKLPGHFTAIGTHVTSTAKETLQQSRLDSVIRREPEVSSLELAEALIQSRDLATVPGISFRQNGEVTHNSDRPFHEELDHLPFPARHLLHNWRYTLPVVNRPYTLLISSRGCPNRCIYCTARQYYGTRVRFRSVESIMAELEEIVTKHNIEYVTMWSDTFTINKPFVMEFCQEVLNSDLKFKWMCNARVDTVDPEMLEAMKQARCIGISYGVESGNQQILDNAKKGITLAQIRQAFHWTREAGIEGLAHVILGLPGETKETIRQTVAFVMKLKPDYAQFYCAVPFPGTEFYTLAKEQNWITTHDWSKYEINQAVISTPDLTAEELDQARIWAYRKFYLRPTYIVGRLKKIRGWQDLVTNVRQGWSFFQQWIR